MGLHGPPRGSLRVALFTIVPRLYRGPTMGSSHPAPLGAPLVYHHSRDEKCPIFAMEVNFVDIYPDCRVTLHRSGIFRVFTFGDTFLTLIAGLLRTCGPFPYVITIAHRQVGTQLLPIIIIISSITIIIITITIKTICSRNNNMDFFKYPSVISDFNK